MSKKVYKDLLEQLKEISYIGQVLTLLRWDQETYMPPGSVKDRANQLALMSGVLHERQTNRALGKMIRAMEKARGLDRDQKVIVREAARDYHRATAIPAELVKEISRTETLAMTAWVKARKDKDYKQFKPWLSKMIGLKKKVAEHIGYEDRPYDALLDEYEPTMRTRDVEAILTPFRQKLVPLVTKVADAANAAGCDDSVLMQHYDVEAQKAFFTNIVKDLGYSFDIGRMDITHHPFTSGSSNDVRITTRYNDKDIRPALFACIHEAGHGIYEQGHLERYHHTPLGKSESLGIHESQSRMYENIVGRGRPFWEHYLPKLKAQFQQVKDVMLDDWMLAINKVQPSFIRVEADEVTYNLHILLRFEIENDIIEDKVGVNEIPQVWNEKMDSYLGIVPPDDSQGCLQDIHWSFGLFGYFSTYTLGNLLACQLYEKIRKDIKDIDPQISEGRFDGLLAWLRKNVHRHGRRYNYLELTKKVTGRDICEDHFINYIKDKFGKLFDVRL